MTPAGRQRRISVDLSRPDATSIRLDYDLGGDVGAVSARMPAGRIADLVELAAAHRFLGFVTDPREGDRRLRDTGQRLYQFLDGPDRLLQRYRDRLGAAPDPTVLMVSADEVLTGLPWELLHDGTHFLVGAPSPVLPVRRVGGTGTEPRPGPAERALRLLFMACSPRNDRLAPLDYDAEHNALVDPDRMPVPLTAVIDDTGDLNWLNRRLGQYDEDYFDVVHLSGHAGLSHGRPVFATEGPAGELVEADARAIAGALRISRPRLLFLSGCRTAEAPDASPTLSLAQELAGTVAPVVLGWGRPVADVSATRAAACLYKVLAQGRGLAAALAQTYDELLRSKTPDPYWHTLRVFVSGDPWEPFVTTARSDGLLRSGAAPVPASGEWLGFVGRRREVQSAIRLLDRHAPADPVGIVYCGMGGIGKSHLARHIAHRLSADYDRVEVHGRLTRKALVAAIDADPKGKPLWTGASPGLSFGDLLTHFLRGYAVKYPQRALLFDLDEFEHSFRADPLAVGSIALADGKPVTDPEAAETLSDLVTAIRAADSGRTNRIILTSRYAPRLDCVDDHFVVCHLGTLTDTDVDRYIARRAGAAVGREDARLVKTAGGRNARLINSLLELLNRGTGQGELDGLGTTFRATQHDFLEKDILAPRILGLLTPADHRLLAAAEPFDVPVPVAVLARLVGQPAAEVDRIAHSLAGLGMLELSAGGPAIFRVPPVLRSDITAAGDASRWAERAAACAAELFAELGGRVDRAYLAEVYRLAVAGNRRDLALECSVTLAHDDLEMLRFEDAAKRCTGILPQYQDHRLWAVLADCVAETGGSDLGRYFTRALECCPAEAPLDRADILASRGFWAGMRMPGDGLADIDEAIRLARAADGPAVLADGLRHRARKLAERSGDHFDEIAVLLTEAMRIAGEPPCGPEVRARVLLDRAIAWHMYVNDYAAADRDLAAALAISEASGSALGQAVALLTMADSAVVDGRHDRGLQWAEDAVQRCPILRVRAGADLVRGRVARERGDFDDARRFFESARTSARQSGNLADQREALIALRGLAAKTGDARGNRYARELERVSVQIDSPQARIDALIGSLADARKAGWIDARTAVARAREAAMLAAVNGDEGSERTAWNLLLDDAQEAGLGLAELEFPLRRLLRLLTGYDESRTARTAAELGRLLLRAGRFADARPLLITARDIYLEHALLESAAEMELRLSEVALGLHETATALELLGSAARRRIGIGRLSAAAQTVRTLATVRRSSAPEQARSDLRVARRLARLAASGRDEAQILGDMAEAAAEPGAAGALRHEARLAQRRSEPLHIDVGAHLVRYADPALGGRLGDHVRELRDEIRGGDGWILPDTRVGTDDEMPATAFEIRVWGEPVHRQTVSPDPLAPPDTEIAGHLRRVAYAHSTALQDGEPPPPPDADADRCSLDDIVRTLRTQV